MNRLAFPFLFLLTAVFPSLHAEVAPPGIRLEIGSHPTGRFDPRHALGGGLDGHSRGDTREMLSGGSVRKMLEAGLGPVSLRLRTELAVEAWHWNPRGRWSDPVQERGYWTSDDRPDPTHPIDVSYGYKLPRRGDTLDEANDDGFSRIDDGDRTTFWKSNPYLTRAYTGEADSRHPQWVVLDFGKKVPINAVNILWGEPYATRFRVEYATKGRVYFGGHPGSVFNPVWRTFPHGEVTKGRGGEQFLQLGRKPVLARYLRIWMSGSSGAAPKGSADPRDAMGYAIREIMAGEAGRFDFDDHVIHRPGKTQTLCYVSSTDPWHRARDLDPKVEQPGIDLLARCGITRGLPMMLAIPVLYDTPENGAALAEYARRAGIPASCLELGEEPDGQRVDPSDFGALYARTALRVREANSGAVMGGPSFVTIDVDGHDDQTYRFDKRWWIREFCSELGRHGEARSLRFLSFEWYPFDDVHESESRQFPRSSGMLARAMRRMGGFHLPLVIGEYNYSVFPCRQEVDLAGGLLNAEIAAQFLCSGGDTAYYYGYEPNRLEQTEGSWGNQLMLLNRRGIMEPVATFRTLRLLTSEWMNPKGGVHQILPLRLHLPPKQRDLVSAFALRRPDGTRSLLIINKDPDHPLRIAPPFAGPLQVMTYSGKQYRWRANGKEGHPSLNRGPETAVTPPKGGIVLPPFSMGVVTESLRKG